jgi:predicted nucleic-acid-binding protein
MTKKVEESVASETLKPQNKSQMLGAALAKLAGLGIEDLSHFLNDTLAQVTDKNSSLNGGGAPDNSAKNQASLNMHPSAASAMKESVKDDLGLILGEGEELSEEIKEKTSTLFEAALESRLIIEREALIEEMNERLEEAYDMIAEEMAEKVNTYLDAVVETWLVENEVAIESALRNEITEDFIDGLKNLFAAHYMNVPEEKVEVAEELAERVVALEERLDEALERASKAEALVLESAKDDAIDAVCEGLALTQAEKLRSLCENVEFDGDVEGFAKKLELVKESVVGKSSTKTPGTGMLVEESDPEAAANGNAPTPGIAPEILRYKEAISRTIRG